MGLEGYQIGGPIRVHHMNPITIEDVKLGNPDIFDPEFLIATSLDTHNAIHFGPNDYGPVEFIERKPNDTIPWKKIGGNNEDSRRNKDITWRPGIR